MFLVFAQSPVLPTTRHFTLPQESKFIRCFLTSYILWNINGIRDSDFTAGGRMERGGRDFDCAMTPVAGSGSLATFHALYVTSQWTAIWDGTVSVPDDRQSRQQIQHLRPENLKAWNSEYLNWSQRKKLPLGQDSQGFFDQKSDYFHSILQS